MTNVTWRKNADYIGAFNDRRTALVSSPGNTLVCHSVRPQLSRGLSNKQKRFEFFAAITSYMIIFLFLCGKPKTFSKFENFLSYFCLKNFFRCKGKTRPKEKCRAKKSSFIIWTREQDGKYEYNPHIPSHQFLSLPDAHIIMCANICPFHTPHRVPLT